ncbi:MAG: glycoside hydrolase family 127 protein, partial [Bacteroidales bacterium]|nr:glycoside hydrolase family 127 protein [Bacteroidales bacterium]MDD4655274.1 glycoside hydrolase family 127 protein [Bacteroidales bacterium]
MITYCNHSEPEGSRESQAQYIVNREPLQPNPYIELPLGSIQARGWLLEMLERQRSGITSSLDELYPQVMGIRNGWLGGDGDQWERGPYWIDGLLPLAYLLDDADLKSKVQPWIEWTLSSQREDGFFGPSTDFSYEKGVQRSNSKDWWPRMVMLKVLCQYYSATADERVISFMTNYFRYQLNTLPQTPLGNWTFWAEYRACENLQAVLWLYNITGDGWLLDLARLLHSQSIDYTHIFLDTDNMKKTASIHGVNLAQGLKEPVIYWQVQADEKYLNAVKKGLQDIRDYNGIPNGMFGADELLHGNNPTQGSELCTAVELMYSLEQMIRITGDTEYADLLEKIAYNALPAQISDDFTSRQYFQQANQVLVTRNIHNFDINHGETDLVFGLLTGYPCCTSNLHQGWPKFTGNLWYA